MACATTFASIWPSCASSASVASATKRASTSKKSRRSCAIFAAAEAVGAERAQRRGIQRSIESGSDLQVVGRRDDDARVHPSGTASTYGTPSASRPGAACSSGRRRGRRDTAPGSWSRSTRPRRRRTSRAASARRRTSFRIAPLPSSCALQLGLAVGRRPAADTCPSGCLRATPSGIAGIAYCSFITVR